MKNYAICGDKEAAARGACSPTFPPAIPARRPPPSAARCHLLATRRHLLVMGRPSLWDEPDPKGKLPLDAPDHKAIDPTSTRTIDRSFARHRWYGYEY